MRSQWKSRWLWGREDHCVALWTAEVTNCDGQAMCLLAEAGDLRSRHTMLHVYLQPSGEDCARIARVCFGVTVHLHLVEDPAPGLP